MLKQDWIVKRMVVNDLSEEYVINVEYELYAEDIVSETEAYKASLFYELDFKVVNPLPPDFTPFNQLTKDDVLMWLYQHYNATNPQDWRASQELLTETFIIEQKKPRTTPQVVPNPWD